MFKFRQNNIALQSLPSVKHLQRPSIIAGDQITGDKVLHLVRLSVRPVPKIYWKSECCIVVNNAEHIHK